jgi:hypothetical protein
MFEKTIAAAFASFRKEERVSSPEAKPVAMAEPEMEAVVGVYRNRWPVTLAREAGALVLEQFGTRFSVTRIGPDLYSAKPPGERPPIPFRLIAGPDGRGELLQMFLWVFKKEKVAP